MPKISTSVNSKLCGSICFKPSDDYFFKSTYRILKLIMFNLNIPASSLLGAEGPTPRTPEIVNSLIAMTNPLDNYNFHANSILSSTPISCDISSTSALLVSQDSSQSSTSVSPLDSPSSIATTPTIQQTCSQLIKAGLKLSIQSKRKVSSCDSSSGNEQPRSKYRCLDDDCEESSDDEIENKVMPKGLTPEDEDRRRRRRERNKIAATKCRMKKRERTNNLIKEAEQLDSQNVDLKTQVRTLEIERRKLVDMLQSHKINCIHQRGLNLPLKLQQSPAAKYLDELELEERQNNVLDSNRSIKKHFQRTIPPMSSIRMKKTNEFKDVVTNVGKALSNSNSLTHDFHLLQDRTQVLAHISNGYCKPSPNPHDQEYFKSSSQESLHSSCSVKSTLIETNKNIVTQLPSFLSNCVSSLGMRLEQSSDDIAPNASSLLINNIDNTLPLIQTPADFVKNELVESQSPYTSAQSAERFLFENNCENYIDIKQAIQNNCSNQEHNLTNNTLEFSSSVIGSSNIPVAFNDNLSLKSDFLHEADLLAQLTADAAEFVDLDSSVASAFMANGGCLA